MRPPAVLKVSLANAYPRCYATRRISASGFYFGPFASRRAADTFASGFLDLFKIRRCQIKIRRDPSFPRLHVFGNENVPRAVFRRLHEGGL